MDIIALTESTQYAHSRMVSKISALLALYAGYSPREAEIISQAALLHDIGKCDIPDGILLKPSALSASEFEVIKTHTQIGCRRIADALDVLSSAATVASQHHERLDGSGYLGMSGTEIDPYARLIAIGDVFDALYSRRSYKEPWSREAVCEYLKDKAGIQFDLEIAGLLLAHIDEITELYRQEGNLSEHSN